MTEQTEGAEVERVVCPEHGQPLALEGRGPEGSGPFFHAWICPECSNVRRCGTCGKAAPEAWSSGRCHDCYRVQSSRLRREEAERKQADYDAAIAAAEARGAERVLAAVEAECAFAEEHQRHVANDEVLVEVGSIRHAARAAAVGGGS